MTFGERLAAIRAAMQAQGLDRLIAIHDGAHFIEKPNPVTVLTGFKALGPSAAVLAPREDMRLVVTPEWDTERAVEQCPGVPCPADRGVDHHAGRRGSEQRDDLVDHHR